MVLRDAVIMASLGVVTLVLILTPVALRASTATPTANSVSTVNPSQATPPSYERGVNLSAAQGYGFISISGAGLPGNLTAPFTLAMFGPGGGMTIGGRIGDGFDFGGSASVGTWTFLALPTPGYIPYPASGTFFVTANETLAYTQHFIPAWPCYQIFAEVGLPVGSEWWVIEGNGLGFFSNGTTIDAIGCGLSSGVSIGTSTDYQVVAFPTDTFYPGGASVPVAFGPPSSPSALPALGLLLLGAVSGMLTAVAYYVGRHGRVPPNPLQPGENEDRQPKG